MLAPAAGSNAVGVTVGRGSSTSSSGARRGSEGGAAAATAVASREDWEALFAGSEGSGLVVVAYTAAWCGECKKVTHKAR
jgi:hypothetical protein